MPEPYFMSVPGENPIRCLSAAEQADPRLALENFFESFHLHEARELLTELKRTQLHSLHNKGQRQQEDWLYFFEKLDLLLEAGWLLR